jgi:putative acetyltransferase
VAPLRQASRRLVRELGVLDNRVGGPGISFSGCHALIEIERHGVMTVGELAAVLELDKSTTSRTVAALGRAGLVGAGADGGDRRRRPLTLTGKGRRKLATLHRLADRQVQEALALLAGDERAAVLRGMELYARALARRRAQQDFAIRPIARIIRDVMTEHLAVSAGCAVDPAVEAMTATYAGPGRGYWVLVRRDQVMGGAGFAPLPGGAPGVCELQKMYFTPEARGLGMGRRLLARALEEARRAGHRTCYLETLESMTRARRLYEWFGFRPLCAPMGATGHGHCDAWYVLDLDERAADAPGDAHRSGIDSRSFSD